MIYLIIFSKQRECAYVQFWPMNKDLWAVYRMLNAVLLKSLNRECFMVYVTHKFRAAIGKSKLIRDGESVLVGMSGGQASSCLLHLIQEVSKFYQWILILFYTLFTACGEQWSSQFQLLVVEVWIFYLYSVVFLKFMTQC